MKIRLTSVTSEDLARALRQVTVKLEDEFAPKFKNKYFGGDVGQFTFVIIAVGVETNENDEFYIAHNKVGKYCDPITKEKVNYISVALPFDPNELALLDNDILRGEIIKAMVGSMDRFSLKIPKEFDLKYFVKYFKSITN